VNKDLLLELAQRFNLRDFVETGTQSGNMFRAMQGHFDRTFTIEILGAPADLYSDFSNVNSAFMFTGSSGDRLPEILRDYKITRALFWLDAHGNQTWYKDDGNNQVLKELDAIAQYAPDSLVVIDDITFASGKFWVNDSYEFLVPSGWHEMIRLDRRVAILHQGGYSL